MAVVQRPTGWIGELYDRLSFLVGDPLVEIELLARRALADDFVDEKNT